MTDLTRGVERAIAKSRTILSDCTVVNYTKDVVPIEKVVSDIFCAKSIVFI